MIIYLLMNRSSFQSLRARRITCHDLGSTTSHIYCRTSKGVDKFVSKGNDEFL
ncbi:hypothetical protein Gotri_022352 [Gossypium trilobum]|uniref:Uncharacterized protein n=1 Tax=Gossypium trilobum TaxID=34281 RepID=A0A7J9DFH6_9ROSI|nr:hypothetical protein [Gossypium trilobum]